MLSACTWGHPSGWALLSKIGDQDFILSQLCLLQVGFLCSGTRQKHLKHRKFQPMVEYTFFSAVTVPCQRWTHSFLWRHTTLTITEVNSNKEGFIICLAFIKFFQFQAGISGVKKKKKKREKIPAKNNQSPGKWDTHLRNNSFICYGAAMKLKPLGLALFTQTCAWPSTSLTRTATSQPDLGPASSPSSGSLHFGPWTLLGHFRQWHNLVSVFKFSKP